MFCKKLIGQKSRRVHLNLRLDEKCEKDDDLVVKFKGLGDILKESSIRFNDYFAQCLQEFVLKLSANAISTGAHVLVGKTYQNIMIDVKVSNMKLFWRAVDIVKELVGSTSRGKCEQVLIEAIFGQDRKRIEEMEAEFGNDCIAKTEYCVQVATGQDLIVPKALLMALTGLGCREAEGLLKEADNSVRNCIHRVKSRNLF